MSWGSEPAGGGGGAPSNSFDNANAWYFKDNDDQVNWTTVSGFGDVFNGGGCLATWISPINIAASDSCILGADDSTGVGSNFYIRLTASSGGRCKVRMSWDMASTDGDWTTTEAVIKLSVWNYLLINYDPDNDGEPQVYVNGERVGLTVNANPAGAYQTDGNGDWFMGFAGVNTHFDGHMSQTAVWKGAKLTSANIGNSYLVAGRPVDLNTIQTSDLLWGSYFSSDPSSQLTDFVSTNHGTPSNMVLGDRVTYSP